MRFLRTQPGILFDDELVALGSLVEIDSLNDGIVVGVCVAGSWQLVTYSAQSVSDLARSFRKYLAEISFIVSRVISFYSATDNCCTR